MKFKGDPNHLEALKKAIRKNDILIWNQFNEMLLKDNRRGDLSGADLKGAYLKYINLKGVNLANADLSEADLEGADLKWVNLKCANLKESCLSRADLRWANLEEANMEKAELLDSDLKRANLERVNLRNSILKSAKLIGANLEGVSLEGANLKDTDFRGAHCDKDILRLIKFQQQNVVENILEIKLTPNWFVSNFIELMNVLERIYDFFIMITELQEVSSNLGNYVKHGENIISAITQNIINNRWRIRPEDRLEIESIETLTTSELRLKGKAIGFLKEFARELHGAYKKVKEAENLCDQQVELIALIENLNYFNKQKNHLIDVGIGGDELEKVMEYLKDLKLKLLDFMEREMIEFHFQDSKPQA